MNFISTLKSVTAAFFGVQSNKNRARDLSEGKLSHFIIVGIIALVIFIVMLITLVSLIIPNSV
ncbi:MAG: DUF2970 domain-containing protein [Colwellia sp.]